MPGGAGASSAGPPPTEEDLAPALRTVLAEGCKMDFADLKRRLAAIDSRWEQTFAFGKIKCGKKRFQDYLARCLDERFLSPIEFKLEAVATRDPLLIRNTAVMLSKHMGKISAKPSALASSSSSSAASPLPSGVMPGGAGDVKPAAPLSSASPAKPTESMLSLVASPLPSGVKPGGAGPPAPVASSSSSVPASVKKVTLRDIRDIPQVPGLLNDFTTRPRTLTFERDTFRPVFGQYHEPEDDGQPLRLGVTPEAAGNEFRRYGQDRAVDHWTAPFELPIETFDESWEEIEKRVPTTLLNALDRKIGRGWVDELLFILGRPAVAW